MTIVVISVWSCSTGPLLTFHLHVLWFAELLLAGFLLLLSVVVVHVGSCCCCGGGRNALFPVISVPLDLVLTWLGWEPSFGLLVRCGRMQRWGGQVEPRRTGLLWRVLGLVRCQRRGVRGGGRRGSGQRNADVFARYSPNLGAFGGCESLADGGGGDGWMDRGFEDEGPLKLAKFIRL